MKQQSKLEYTLIMLKVISNNLDYLIEEADYRDYDKNYIQTLREMKEDIKKIKEVIDDNR